MAAPEELIKRSARHPDDCGTYSWMYDRKQSDTIGKIGDDHQEGRSKGRVQQRIPSKVPFPCNLTASRSKVVPKSVNELRPGDIDIIGVMGDSIMAGTGIFATSIIEIAVESRGVSAFGGGQGTWREYLTIPNIIKEFNPDLIGYSLHDSLTHQAASGFNVAEVAAMSRDLPYMTENLIRRIKNHPKVDFKNHWKLIGIIMGANDLCNEMCNVPSGPWSVLKNHKNDLINTLRILKKKLPRTLVFLIPPPNVKLLVDLPDKPLLCSFVSKMQCPCFVGLRWRSRLDEFIEIIHGWQRMDEEISYYPEFRTEEFAVVFQPFTTNGTVPLKSDGSVDWSYLSADCFHLSQMGHAVASKALWKNMLEPVGRKTSNWSDSGVLSCPTESRPYIATFANSRDKSNMYKN